MRSVIDRVGEGMISGWVSRRCPKDPPLIQINDGGEIIYEGYATHERKDLGNDYSGFSINIDRKYIVLKIALGQIVVTADSNGHKVISDVWAPVRVAAQAASLSAPAFQHFSNTLDTLSGTCRVIGSVNPNEAALQQQEMVSDDEVAITSRSGHLFLFRGTNDVVRLYGLQDVSPAFVNDWVDVVASRFSYVNALGAKFLQVFIPEKSTSLSHITPYPVSGANVIFKTIISACEHLPILDFNREIDIDLCKEAWWRRYDSHFSSYGAYKSSLAICRALGLIDDVLYKMDGGFVELIQGDLGVRFAGHSWCSPEPVYLCSKIKSTLKDVGAPLIVKAIDPEAGHTGIIRVFRNENSLFDKKMVCFGNSFFERGGRSTTLSWWFSRLFREFHFVWSPDLDVNYIEAERPDFVVAQSIERFLTRVPRA